MLIYTSAPLERDVGMSGHPVVSLGTKSNQPDAAAFVYLSEVEADGHVRYVTEGVLRALHPQGSALPADGTPPWRYRAFTRADAAPLRPGRPELLRFGPLPTSWRFRAGSRIRLAIAGADADHYVQVPHGRPPRLRILRILRGGSLASMIELPWRRVQ